MRGPPRTQEGKASSQCQAQCDQLYKQIWKDARKHRVLVVDASHEFLGGVISSPFEAVDKMMPDRSIAPDKRIAHDQRGVNVMTDKELHPPAVQPKHAKVARMILWNKRNAPGLEVVMSKKDISGAFRLVGRSEGR